MPAPSESNSPSLARLRPWIERFADLEIVVWGDVVADRFLYGSTNRVSREAPALVIRYESEETRPGGAGNAMMNAAALGARVRAVGFLGADGPGDDLRRRLSEGRIGVDGLVSRSDAATPIKTRVMAGGVHTVRQQVLRIDHEAPWSPDAGFREELEAALRTALQGADALVISDYALGSARPELYGVLLDDLAAREIPVFLDSRAALLEFPGVTAATPNEEEVEFALRVRFDGSDAAVERIGGELIERLGCEALLITRGSLGMSVFESGEVPVHLPIHGSDEIADVTGAGDAVIATFALAVAAGAPVLEAASLANVAGGIAVNQRGTAPVSASGLGRALEGES